VNRENEYETTVRSFQKLSSDDDGAVLVIDKAKTKNLLRSTRNMHFKKIATEFLKSGYF